MSLRLQACSLLVAGLLLVQCSGAQSPVVRFDQAKGVFLLEGWSGLSQVKPAELADVLVVSVDAPDIPPLLGRHTVENGALVFTPQYKVQEGMRYKAVARIPGMDPISTIADLPKRVIEPSTVVAAVYPSTDVLPENQLKFYIHFSASMSQGDAFTHMTLMDDTGTPIKDQPFLARSGELWDREFKRFTLFFDPGRVKRELGPSMELGPALLDGKRYSLVIDRAWIDAQGVPMKETFKKNFRVGPPDRKPLDLATWKIVKPKAGTKDPVAVEFGEPMDHAITLRELDVFDPSGNAIDGAVALDRGETRWQLTPTAAWKAGSYKLRVGAVTADLAGNMIGRPFEVDLFEKIDERILRQTHDIPFKIE